MVQITEKQAVSSEGGAPNTTRLPLSLSETRGEGKLLPPCDMGIPSEEHPDGIDVDSGTGRKHGGSAVQEHYLYLIWTFNH
jgi:hypothetical protein